MEQEPIYYKSDFDFPLPLKDAEGNAIGWPGHDWEARFTTAGNLRGYTAGCRGGVCRNCVRDGEGIRIIADRHGLPPGRVMCEITVRVPDSRYPDGTRSVAGLYELDIRLTDEPGKAAVIGEIRLPVIAGAARALPFLFGEPTYDGGAVFFRRDLGRFILGDGSDAPAPYNERLADGRVTASREGRFECGGKEYRFTGRELVNTAWEKSPGARSCLRVPSLSAHPGIIYRNRGFITLRRSDFRDNGDGTATADLSGLYYAGGIGGGIRPLAGLPIDGSYEDYRDGLVTISADGYGNNGISVSLPASPLSLDGIMARYDGAGRKIFVRVETGPAESRPVAPETNEVGGSLKWDGRELRWNPSSGRLRIEIWLRRKLPLPRMDEKRYAWKWRPLQRRFEKGGRGWRLDGKKSVLLRARREVGRNASDWAYFHCALDESDFKLKPSRPRRGV